MAEKPVDKGEGRIRQMFGEIAPVYDTLNHVLSLNIDKRWRRRTVELAPPEGDGPILDLCTGSGDLALEYAGVTNGPVVGADFCHELLVRARRKTHDDRVTYVEADGQRMPFADNTFQLVTVAFGLRNITDTDRGLAEMARVTKPGGRVAVLEFSKPDHWLLGRLYRAYFQFVLPAVGQVLSGSKHRAYKYLPASVMQFPDGDAMLGRMRCHGLTDAWRRTFTFGVATLYVGRKPGIMGDEDKDARGG